MESPVGSSDHGLLCCSLSCPTYLNNSASNATGPLPFNFEAIRDWTVIINSIAQSPWHQLYATVNPNDAATLFNTFISAAINDHIPRRPSHRAERKLPFVTAQFKYFSRLKKQSWNRYKRSFSEFDLNCFRRNRNLLRDEIRRIKRDSYVHEVERLIASPSSKRYWKLARKVYKFSESPHALPDLHSENFIARNIPDKCNLLNEHFAPNLPHISRRFPASPDFGNPPSPIISDVTIDAQVVLRKLKGLDIGKSMGPDCIPNLLLKKCAAVLVRPLTYIFRLCIDQCTMPTVWKFARVSAIYKGKGDRTNPKSYRPISVTSCIGKMLENIVNDCVVDHLLENNLIHESQFGFLRQHSTCDQLALIHNLWAKAMDRKQSTFAAFLDFSNAFGTVPHDALRWILPGYGVRGKLFGWFSDYLDDRFQVTQVEKTLSARRPLTCGVPQGSVVAPSLFIMFINSLLHDIDESKRLMACDAAIGSSYADDTLVAVSHVDEITAAVQLENLLTVCSTWAENWGMSFNAAKTVCMRFSRKKNATIRHINFLNTNLPFASSHIHLGVCLTPDLKFNNHISNICSRISKELYVLRILKQNIPAHSFLLNQLYRAFHFEYCSILLSGIGISLSSCLEALQRKAIRIILGRRFRDTVTTDDYLFLGLDKLAFRRNFALACYAYKLYHDICPRALTPYKPKLVLSVYATRHSRFRLDPSLWPNNAPSELFRRTALKLTAEIRND